MTFYLTTHQDPTAAARYDWFLLSLGCLLLFAGLTLFFVSTRSDAGATLQTVTSSATLGVSGVYLITRSLGVAMYSIPGLG